MKKLQLLIAGSERHAAVNECVDLEGLEVNPPTNILVGRKPIKIENM